MLCGPKGSEEASILRCSVCGRRTELFELPGGGEKYCWECSADVATSILLTTEIDAATLPTFRQSATVVRRDASATGSFQKKTGCGDRAHAQKFAVALVVMDRPPSVQVLRSMS